VESLSVYEPTASHAVEVVQETAESSAPPEPREGFDGSVELQLPLERVSTNRRGM
jgi:hypothetical protein